jgi:hypothetical protein
MPGGVAGERPMKAVPYAEFFVTSKERSKRDYTLIFSLSFS